MAYLSKNLSVLAYANGFTLWHYTTTETAATVDSSGYFNNASDMLRVGDIIIANLETGGTAKSLLHLAAETGSTASERDISARDKEKILRAAKEWEGTPYAPRNTPLAGDKAKKKEGGDCSGSTHRIFDEAELGYKYTDSSSFSEAVKSGKIPFRKVETNEIQPTDIVVFEGVGHMAIYAGNGNVYSARRTGGHPYGVYPMQWFGANRSYYRYQK
jgi:cell wall-associated NlpC family hydrolase